MEMLNHNQSFCGGVAGQSHGGVVLFAINPEKVLYYQMVKGILEITSRGFGFVLLEDKEDLYISRDNLNGALHGDLVTARIKRSGKKPEGVIIDVLERKIKNIVGTLMHSKTGAFIIPDDDRLGTHFDICAKSLQRDYYKTLVGKKVVTRLLNDNRVELIEVLGNETDLGVDILGIIRAHNLYQDFPDNVEKEAAKIAEQPMDIENRLDLRKQTVVTIDPADAKDLDDAISLEKRADGHWELGVHIADVAHYVREGSALDTEAYERGTSVYFPDRVLPMLPSALSNDVCSLNPNIDRLTLSVIMTIDPNGDVVGHSFQESVINIKQRFNYDEVQAILDGKKHKLAPLLNEASRLTELLEKKRRSRGEVTLSVPEPKIILDPETGKISDVIAYPHHLSHRIIESFMILCNEVVATKMQQLEMPFIYRIHEKPDSVKVTAFIETLKPFGVQHHINPEKPNGRAYQKMLEDLSPEVKPIISQLALRSMQKAKYSHECLGHFGLGSTNYCHFTSPIRRYPDLVIHRIIKMMINRKISTHKREELFDFVKQASVQSSKREVAAVEAEREVLNLKRAEYMSDKIGEKFTGTISGVREFGIFVYLPNTVEGLVRVEYMPQDNYIYNERQMTLVGRRQTFKMGDKIEVIVASVNLSRRQIEFSAI